jgi:hypothetical protein
MPIPLHVKKAPKGKQMRVSARRGFAYYGEGRGTGEQLLIKERLKKSLSNFGNKPCIAIFSLNSYFAFCSTIFGVYCMLYSALRVWLQKMHTK